MPLMSNLHKLLNENEFGLLLLAALSGWIFSLFLTGIHKIKRKCLIENMKHILLLENKKVLAVEVYWVNPYTLRSPGSGS
jgi:uncharacterized iron-regulated membrane protein